MAKDALERLERTVLFETLQTREDETRTGHEISERVRAVVGHVAPLLERVPEKMPEFTLHDPNHGAKVVALMAQFLPADTLARLNVVELSILIYAAYLHDLGMTCSTDEREEAVRGDAEFARQLAADETRSLRLQRLKEEGDHRAATAVEDQVFTEYLRRTHVRRSARFIEETLSGEEESALAISWQGTPYSRWVRTVCDSHELPVSRLRDTKTWPRDALVRNLRVNVQYLSLVLRLADILDLDPERTPKVLLDFINPKDPTSVREWHKHRSVIGWEITPERIRFEAECTHPVYERALREFLDWIEVERQDSVLLASSYRDELSGVYRFDLTEPVTKDRVRSDGTYIYSDLKFNIDYQRVLNLLMGERLYGSPVVALRELLQNSVDAVRLRQALCERDGEPFEPHIAVKLEGDMLVVEDNGVGMDEHIVKNYFMQVGRSYYRSAEFRARQLDIDPVSEFGIGILSVFMVAHACEVESRRHPDDPLNPQPPVRIEIPTAYDYFVQRHTERKHVGTTIKLFLKLGHPFSSDYLRQIIPKMAPFIEYSISVSTSEGTWEYRPSLPGASAAQNQLVRRFAISLEDANNPVLEGTKGNLFVVGGPHYRRNMLGVVAQRGFAVANFISNEETEGIISSDSSHLFELFPSWTTIEPSIDLRDISKLTLTPARDDVIVDERFSHFKLAIENRTVESYRTHLEAQRDKLSPEKYSAYIDELLDEGSLRAEMYIGFKLSDSVKELFLDLVPLPCISNEGKQVRCLGRELEHAQIIAVTCQTDWPNGASESEIRREATTLGPNTSLVLQTEPGNYARSNFLEYIFGEATGYLITNVPGVVFDVISNLPSVTRGFYIDGKMMFTQGLTSLYSSTLPVFVHTSAPTYFESPRYNANHALLAPFLANEAPKNDDCKKLLLSLDEHMDEIFTEMASLGSSSITIGIRRGISIADAPNAILTGVLKRAPESLNLIRSTFADFWRKAQEAGAIDADVPFPGLTAEDLPWFWSYEEKQGKTKARRGGRRRKEGRG